MIAGQSDHNMETAETDSNIPYPEEIIHLDDVLKQLREELLKAAQNVEQYDEDYKASKRYLAEYRHEIDPKEIFQNEMFLNDIERSGMIAVQTRERLKRLLESPYFSRLDFCEEGEPQPEAFYIGAFTFAKAHEILIYDWRAPVAGMFYEHQLGPAGYDAPIGRINGRLERKRQFKIESGKLQYVLETAMNIRDDILQRELGSTSDEKMKTIIATLQKEQNRIIRNEEEEVLVIQGVAGSGKTSIALHRIAYLLYRHRNHLTARNVAIISPNKVFGDYISNVLPELGEEPIYELSLRDIAAVQLGDTFTILPDQNPLEPSDGNFGRRMAFKSNRDFVQAVDDYLKQMSRTIFKPADYSFDAFTVSHIWIWQRYLAYEPYPVRRRLEEMAEDIYEKFLAENYLGEALPGKPTILKELKKMLQVKDTWALYKGFYGYIGQPDLLVIPKKNTLEWMDVYPFLYFHNFYNGLMVNHLIRHLVIDEMQDYTAIEYQVINKLFQCRKTILGDFGQSINPHNKNNLEDMAAIYSGNSIVRLNKSYRSSYEIIRFAARIYPVSGLQAVEHHGQEPQLVKCSDGGQELMTIKRIMKGFTKSSFATMGIITKGNLEAAKLYHQLKEAGVNLLTGESRHFQKGITITSIQMSKGLEFDQVLLPFANKETYHDEVDRGLLYIACTRALHKLDFCYCGSLTPLVDRS